MSNFHLYPYIDTSGNSNFISYNSNINDKSLISIYWNDIIDKPSFCNISTTNNYNDLNNETWNNISLNSYSDKLIGIGTNNPLYNLDINGSINLTGTLNKNKSPYQNSQWITENSNIYFNNGSISIGSSTINDNFNINGNIKINGNIISSNNDLGTSNYKWRHLYLSSNSIYIDNITISKSDSNYVKINSITLNEIYLNSNYYIHIDNGLILYNNKYPVLFNNNYDKSNIILSNTFISSSNNIKSKITNLNTDTLIQGVNNKFIINDIYNNNITFTNNLISSNIICSNLTVIGDTTIFNTPIYETEQLQVINDTTATSLIVKKSNNNKNIAEFYNKNQISFIISSNKNVGIGTSNPSYKLDIYGSINTNGDLFIKNTNISNIIDTKNTNLNNILLEYNNHINKPNLNAVSLSGNYNNLNTIPFYISGNNIYTLSNKNIGIGKYNPNYILDINGPLNTSQEILIISNIIDNKITNTSNILINYNNHNNLPLLKPIATSGNYYDIINRPNQYGEYSNYNNLINNIWINNNNNNIYTNFNIGIGITNSSYKLYINGSLNTSQEVLIKGTNISNIIDNKLQSSNNILINYNNFINKPTLSLVATNGYYSNLNQLPILTTVAITGYYSNVSNNPFIILGNNLYSSFIGNLGIGITNPLYKLDINGSLNTSQEILIKGTNISNIIDNKNITNSNLIKTKITSLNTDTIPIGINNKFIVNNVYNNNIIFTKNVTTSNLIASNLNVIGDSTTYNTTVYITKKVEINNNTNYTSLKISQLNSTKNVCEIYNNNSQLAFFINSNGNIGIFNGNPSYKLDINGSLNTSQEILIKGTNISNIIDNKLLSSSNILINYNNFINKPNLNTIATSGNYNDLLSKPFIISGNNIYNNINNIGIGISNTSYKLNINGSLNTSQELLIKGTNISNIIDNKITNTSNILINYSNIINRPVLKTVATSGSYYDLINTPNNISDYKQLSNIPFSFNTTNSNLIYNTSNGNLGIGSTIPNYKVSINNNFNYNGNMRISNVLVPFSYYSNTNITTSNGTFNYITNNNLYGYYLFRTSGSITFPQATNCDILLVAAGGNGGMSISSGGGGAGEVIYYPNYPFSAGTSNIIIGYSDSNANNRRSFLRYNNNNIITALGGGDGSSHLITSYTHLFVEKKPWGIYFAENFANNILYDTSGNNRHATTSGTILKSTSSGNGATGQITYIYGNTSSTVLFPVGSIPATFTILSLTRYNGGTNRRILTSATTGNFLHGHWNGNSGVCHYDAWMTSSTSSITLNNWLCTIGKNNSTNPNNILINGIASGTASGGTGNYRLGINNNQYGETSDWALSCVMIWDTILTDSEMQSLNTIITNYLSTGKYTINPINNYNDIFNINSAKSGGSGGGSRGQAVIIKDNLYTSINVNVTSYSSNSAVAETKWNASYSYSTNGSTGSASIGGNGGSATATGGYIENITGTNMIIGVGGTGASSTSIPSLKYTYGSGGDGNGGLGTQGLVIIKVPLNISKLRFDGYLNYSNIINRPYINDLFISKNFLEIGIYNQVNFPLGDTSWANEWFLYMGRSPTNISNSFIFWHLNSNAGINSKWWFNGTIASTNNEISDIRIKKEIIDIINPLQNLMLLQPKEYYICDEKDYIKKYGIIAQNTKEYFPDFIYKDEDYIANIYDIANYYEINNNNLLVFTKEHHDITIGDELKLLFNNNIYNQEIIIENIPYHNRYKKRYIIVDNIIDSKTIKIKNRLEYLTEEEKINIFVYGKKVNDFLKLDYSSLYCLNIKCNQELYKKYIEQQNKLLNLKERILKLES